MRVNLLRSIFGFGCVFAFLISLCFMVTISFVTSSTHSFACKINSLNSIYVSLSCFICFSLILSSIGIVSVYKYNTQMLIIYDILSLIFFLIHLGLLIIFLCIYWPKLNGDFRRVLNETITDIINTTINDSKCDQMRQLSHSYACCGLNGPHDFLDKKKRIKCCTINQNDSKMWQQGGCGDKATLNDIKHFLGYFIVAPSIIVLFVEIISIVGSLFVIKYLYRTRPVYFQNYEVLN